MRRENGATQNAARSLRIAHPSAGQSTQRSYLEQESADDNVRNDVTAATSEQKETGNEVNHNPETLHGNGANGLW